MGKLCVVFASQRVGSTMFETSLSRAGDLGQHGEPWAEIQTIPEKTWDRDLLLEKLEYGRDGSGATAVTIMESYLTAVAKAYFNEPYSLEDRSLPYAEKFWASFRDRFSEAACFYLIRNPLGQALSQYFASRTGLYHVMNNGMENKTNLSKPESVEEVLEGFDPEFLIKLIQLCDRQNAFLTAFLQRTETDYFEVKYEDMVQNPTAVGHNVLEYAGSQASVDRFSPGSKKVLNTATTDEAKRKLREFFGYFEKDGQKAVSDDVLVSLARAHGLSMDGLSRIKHSSVGGATTVEGIIAERDHIIAERDHAVKYPWKYIRSAIARKLK